MGCDQPVGLQLWRASTQAFVECAKGMDFLSQKAVACPDVHVKELKLLTGQE
jgi:hypothetical protein